MTKFKTEKIRNFRDFFWSPKWSETIRNVFFRTKNIKRGSLTHKNARWRYPRACMTARCTTRDNYIVMRKCVALDPCTAVLLVAAHTPRTISSKCGLQLSEQHTPPILTQHSIGNKCALPLGESPGQHTPPIQLNFTAVPARTL